MSLVGRTDLPVNAAYSWENVERDYFEHEGYFVAEGTSEDRYSASALSGFLSKANGYSARTKNTYWVMDHIVNFNRQFGKHFIDATYVYTRDSKRYDYRKMTGSDFSDQGIPCWEPMDWYMPKHRKSRISIRQSIIISGIWDDLAIIITTRII